MALFEKKDAAKPLPRHIAMIMAGNGRGAQKRGQPPPAGPAPSPQTPPAKTPPATTNPTTPTSDGETERSAPAVLRRTSFPFPVGAPERFRKRPQCLFGFADTILKKQRGAEKLGSSLFIDPRGV